jgi:hypothetical protein
MIDSTGPKISSWASSLSGSTSAKTVGATKCPRAGTGASRPPFTSRARDRSTNPRTRSR